MKTDRTQKGQALILIVFAVIGLLALTGLAVDGSVTYSNRQGAQSAAETAALTGALDLANSKSSNAVSDAQGAAATNGFDYQNTAANTVTVNVGSFTPGCNGTTPSFSSNNSQYVQVIIQTNVSTSFSSIVGVKQMHNCVDAIARGQSGSTGSMFNGAAIVSTDNSSGCNQTMLFNGSANVTTTGGGIFDNCSGSSAVLLNGGVTLNMSVSGQDVGGILNNGGNTITPGITTNAVGVTMPAAAWATIPAVPTLSPTCSGNGVATLNPSTGSNNVSGTPQSVTVGTGTGTLTPGNYSGITVQGGALTFGAGTYCISGLNISSGSVTFGAGTYLLNGSINMSGGTVNGPSGQVNLVMGSNSINQNGGNVSLSNTDLEIYTTSGGWTINSSGNTLNTKKLRFYSSGSGTFTVNGGDTLTSNDSFFYLTSGSVTWNGNSTITLAAPPTGDPYAGLAIYMPWSNTSSFLLNGGSGVNITGTILAPHSDITANGASNFQSLNSQIVGYDFIFNGGGTFKVNFNAGQNYGTPTTAYVELIK